MHKLFGTFFIAEILQGVRPKKVAHGTESRWFFETIKLKQRSLKYQNICTASRHNLFNIVKSVNLGRKAAVNAQKLLVHQGG